MGWGQRQMEPISPATTIVMSSRTEHAAWDVRRPPKLWTNDRFGLTANYRTIYSIKCHNFKTGDRTMGNIGYARVSTNGQDLALQHEALKAVGCEKVYAEKISGARSDRPQLARMLKALAPRDTVIVTRLD